MKINSDLLALHSAVLLLGMTGLFAKFLSLNPVAIICGRTFFTFAFLFVCMLFLRKPLRASSHNDTLMLIVSGLLLSLHWYAFFHSIQLSTVAIGVIGFATYPIFVTFLEPIVFREKYGYLDIISALTVFVGLYFVAPEFDFSNQYTEALIWAVASGFLLAVYSLINRRLIQANHFLLITCYQNVCAFLFTLPFVGLFQLWPAAAQEYGLLALLGVVFTAIPQTLLVRGLKVVKAQVASILVGLEPLYSILLAVLLLNEIPALTTVFGGIIVTVAVFLAAYSHSRNVAPIRD